MAVQEQDLRLGNIFIGYDDKPFTWSLNDFGLLIKGIEIDELIKSPVTLTEDWLLKFGFTFKGMGTSGAVYSRHTGHWYRNGKAVFYGVKGSYFDCFLLACEIEVNINYIHQLQNLVHSLSGEELTVKL